MKQEGFNFNSKSATEKPTPSQDVESGKAPEKEKTQYFLVSFSRKDGGFVPSVAYEAIDEKDLREKIQNSASGLIIENIKIIDRSKFEQMNKVGNYYN